ncbi:MAG: hypothetical protein QNJ00_05410 [Woeseiaceae bacterium]|nr:hypothetical protein [Woeseiaceae bacterium]
MRGTTSTTSRTLFERIRSLLGFMAFSVAGCAGQATDSDPESAKTIDPAESTQVITDADGNEVVVGGEVDSEDLIYLDCIPPGAATEEDPMLEKTQKRVYQVVYHSSRWFDGLFGSSNVECAGKVRYGYVGTGLRWDERDGTKARFRFKAKIALPALNERARLVVGRVDTNDFVDGSDDDNIDSLPARFNDIEDQEFVLGLGFGNTGGLRKGWDFGVGVKLRSPVEPYAKLSYHWNPVVAERWLWRITPQAFAQKERGSGFSLSNIVDFAISERWLIRSWSIGVVEDEVEGTAWTSKLTAYQSLSLDRAFAYSVYASGETENEVELLDYGAEVRYRRSVFRPWVFMELSTSLSWPREFLIEERERNIGVGVEFNMLFGDDQR